MESCLSLVAFVVCFFASLGNGRISIFDLENFTDDDDIAYVVMKHGQERPLKSTDRIATHRAPLNATIRYTALASDEECVLRRVRDEVQREHCEDLPYTECKEEFVLFRRKVVENCAEQEEYCETFRRWHTIEKEVVVCESRPKIECNDEKEAETGAWLGVDEVCFDKRVATCKQVPELVTMVERRQKCNGDANYMTTKLCVTHEDGTGKCKNLTSPYDVCDARYEMKVVHTEVGHETRLDCSERRREKQFCHPASCRVVSNKTECVTGKLPGHVELKETVCEKCLEGRVKVRPVLDRREVCRDKVRHFCLNITESVTHNWKKWCLERNQAGASASGYHRDPRADADAGDVDDKQRSMYHVEVAPGEWVSTSNPSEARYFLDMQDWLEANLTRLESNEVGAETATGKPPPRPSSPVLVGAAPDRGSDEGEIDWFEEIDGDESEWNGGGRNLKRNATEKDLDTSRDEPPLSPSAAPPSPKDVLKSDARPKFVNSFQEIIYKCTKDPRNCRLKF